MNRKCLLYLKGTATDSLSARLNVDCPWSFFFFFFPWGVEKRDTFLPRWSTIISGGPKNITLHKNTVLWSAVLKRHFLVILVEAVRFWAALCSTCHNCDVSVQKSIIFEQGYLLTQERADCFGVQRSKFNAHDSVPNNAFWVYFLLAGSLKQWRTPHPTKHIYLKTIIYYVSNKNVGRFFQL